MMKQVNIKIPFRMLGLLLGLFLSVGAFAQITVKGHVKDSQGEPIIGATIRIAGQSTGGTISDFDGNFTLKAKQGATLNISYVGYQTASVAAAPNVVVTLQDDQTVLNDVVVIGYGVAKKNDLTGSVVAMKPDEKNHGIVTTAQDMIQGKIAGVNVNTTSGEPGGSAEIRIRGGASLNASNSPLIVIDGMPMDNNATKGMNNPLSLVNPNDIESFTVLKDASATAIYGSRGSNGVIIITTKKGRKNQSPKVAYNGTFSVSALAKKLEVMDASEYRQFIKDYYGGENTDAYKGLGDANTDWQDEIFRVGHTTSHNVSLQGKSDAVNYFVSANYYDRKGIIIESDYQKYSFRFNLDGKYKRFKYGINVAPSYSVSNRVNASGSYGNEGVVQSALASCPIWPVYNADGSFNYQGNGYWRIGNDYQHNEILNPVALAKLKSDKVERMTIVGRIYAGFDFGYGISFQTSFGGNYYGAQNDTFRQSTLPLLGKAYYDNPSNPVGESSHGSYFNWLWENQLNYNATFGDHSINAVLVQSAQKETYRGVYVKATDYPNDYIQTITGGTVTDGTSKTTQWALASYLARVQYSYLGRYMLSAAIRADGSSRFGSNHRWGYFPSASVAWRFSDEKFIKDKKFMSWLNDAKLRFSYGKTGNFDIGNYEHLATMGIEDYVLGTGDGSRANGYKPNGVENPDLTWEKTSMMNFGLDITAFDGYFGATIEYYNSKTTDMLLNVPIPLALPVIRQPV